MSRKSKQAARERAAIATSNVVAISPGEWKRKSVHIAVGGFALALRFLTPTQAALMAIAAFIFNWQVLPRIGGKSMWRSGEVASHPAAR